ncbi:MAG: hypothetical protein AAFO04_28270 [Cyanobacteria bacterium J06592_8]
MLCRLNYPSSVLAQAVPDKIARSWLGSDRNLDLSLATYLTIFSKSVE